MAGHHINQRVVATVPEQKIIDSETDRQCEVLPTGQLRFRFGHNHMTVYQVVKDKLRPGVSLGHVRDRLRKAEILPAPEPLEIAKGADDIARIDATVRQIIKYLHAHHKDPTTFPEEFGLTLDG